MDNKNVNTTGISATGVLLIIFVVLKLLGVIKWSWFWVLSPLWITWGLVNIIIIALVIWKILSYR